MYKFIFDLLTDPLSLPIPAIYEYIILFVIGGVAFQIAWEVSPGGRLGSEIHWFVRVIAFFVIWAIIYGVIAVCQWLLRNWIPVVYVLGGILALGIALCIIRNIKRKKIERKEDALNERNEEQRS